MKFEIEFTPGVLKDLEKLEPNVRTRIISKIEELKNNLTNNVKHLTNFTPEYRLRISNFRELFEIDGSTIIIYHIKRRDKAYS